MRHLSYYWTSLLISIFNRVSTHFSQVREEPHEGDRHVPRLGDRRGHQRKRRRHVHSSRSPRWIQGTKKVEIFLHNVFVYVMLCYLTFFFILSHLILSYLISSHIMFSHLISSYLILSYLSYVTLSNFIWFNRILSYLVLPCLILVIVS